MRADVFSACIVVDGKEVEEYNAEELEQSRARCFVPSVSDQLFCVKVSSQFTEDVVFSILVDGQRVHNQVCPPGTVQVVQGVDESSTAFRPLSFKNIELTDDDELRGGSAYQDLGCIEVRVRRFVQGSEAKTRAGNFTAKVKNEAVHERSKKAGTHRIALGHKKTRKPVRYLTMEYVDALDEPYASIKFLYRPAELLRALEIMQLPSTGKHKAASSKDIQDENSERARSLAAKEERIRQLRAQAEQIRAEVDAERDRRGIKREASPIRLLGSSTQILKEDSALKNKAAWQDLGCIDVRVCRFDQASKKPSVTVPNNAINITSDPVHERSKKAGAHRIGYVVAGIRTVLQAQGIMPPPPPATGDKRKRNGGENDNDEDEDEDRRAARKALAEKEERIRALLAEAEQVKAEADAERGILGIKREPSPISLPPSSSSRKRVFIDLTDD
ncbi:hypothetical protein EIP91_010967 [Steccherinum ochraceum]|uniref:DUF7918 domain-containing protein n=1 Tax=Steccherinum ochraceum TaxID=92696 RepID=A0A4R0RS71_9APHY|nr:hypothetical protein EIP91_010967 [Steccherinum ochraceum]